MLLYVLCTAGEFVWNEGGVVPATCYLLPAPKNTPNSLDGSSLQQKSGQGLSNQSFAKYHAEQQGLKNHH